MNWKTEAVERLRQYTGAKCAMETLHQEIRRIETQMCSPGSNSFEAVSSGGGNRQEDWLLNQIMSRQELQSRLERTRDWVTVTDIALDSLSQEERTVLQRLYIQPKKNNVDRLCEELSIERSSIYRKRDKALEKFTLAMYGPVS